MDALNKGMSHQIHTMQNSNTETCNLWENTDEKYSSKSLAVIQNLIL